MSILDPNAFTSIINVHEVIGDFTYPRSRYKVAKKGIINIEINIQTIPKIERVFYMRTTKATEEIEKAIIHLKKAKREISNYTFEYNVQNLIQLVRRRIQGFPRAALPIMTAVTPVSSIMRFASSGVLTSPFPMTGISSN